MPRNISDNGLHFVAAWEKFMGKAYRATPAEKYLTIGYGHYGSDVKEGQKITEGQALILLNRDMAKAVGKANELVHPVFNQAQFDAICDLCYNVGTGVIEKDDQLGDFDDAVRLGNVAECRRIMGQFVYQKGKKMLGLQRRTAGRLALFDGKPWQEAEKIGRAVQ
ncbi:MAG: lysozyme [Citrobacter sp.]